MGLVKWKEREYARGVDVMRKIAIVLMVALLAALFLTGVAYAGKPPKDPPGGVDVSLIVAEPSKGMYCADPAGWINKGFKIYVWGDSTPVKAQAYDSNGVLITPGIDFKVTATGETGSMGIADSTNKVYSASPKSIGALTVNTNNSNHQVEYTAGGKTFTGIIRRWNSKCDGCHTDPPGHALANAGSNGGSTCRNCHDLADQMKRSHAARVPNNTSAAACYSCHPSPCYSGVHNQFGIDCVSCHGSLADAPSGNMKITHQKGLPRCEDCHVSPREAVVPYAQNNGKEYKESVGHGRANKGAKNLCITCHNSMHMEANPAMAWGDGTNNNCVKCHVNKPTDNNMGPVCGNCHRNSFNPHLAAKR